MENYYKYKILEVYRDGDKWTHYYPSKQQAEWGMEELKAAHPGRSYELVKVAS